MYQAFTYYYDKTFCRLLSQYMKIRDPQQVDTLLCNLMTKKLRNNTTGWEREFVRCCQQLVALHHFEPIVRFVYTLFSIREQCDMQLLKKLLCQVKIREDYDLAQLCQDFAVNMHNANPWNDPFAQELDLYQATPAALQIAPGENPTIRNVLPLTLMQHVYGICVPSADQLQKDTPYLCQEHVDAVAKFVLQEAAESGCYQQEFSEHDCTKALSGAMLGLLRLAEFNVNLPLCHYILETYLLPTLLAVPWSSLEKKYEPALANIVYLTADYMEVILGRDLPTLNDKTIPGWYPQNVFYREMLGKGDASQFMYASDNLIAFCQSHSLLCEQWAQLLQLCAKNLKDAMTQAGRQEAFSHHLLSAAFLLYFSGKQETSAYFLLRHIGELQDAQRRRPHFAILLSRCVLSAPRLENANSLYGLFCYEMDRPERERSAATSHAAQMVQFLLDAEDYIRNNNRTHHDILFGDGQIMAQVAEIQARLQRGDLITHMQFRYLVQVTDAFSRDTDVRLLILGLPKVNGDDKLFMALSSRLARRGRALLENYEEFKIYWDGIGRNDALRNVNLHLQNRLYQLQCAQVKDNLQRATALKQALPVPASQAEEDERINQISQIVDSLTGMLLVSRQGRTEAERNVLQLREAFEQTYACENLLEKLPEEVREDVCNYLVTSTLVLQMMENQKDDALDYSAALISMTKALELVMHYIYTRLDVKYDDAFIVQETDKKSEKERKEWITATYFTSKLEPRENLTLRPYLEILSSDRFALWGMDQVLDISMLSQFEKIALHTRKPENETGNKSENFGEDPQKNRRTLKKALVYICENYRNRSAHPNVVTLMEAEKCRQLLIDGQNLLWILLAILK